MSKSTNQKLKLLYLLKIFQNETDELHGIKMSTIINKLESNGISAERKSIYSDIESLKEFGYDIIYDNNTYEYYLGEREFETPELKLLVDSVQSSKFITEKKSLNLIKKLEGFTSVHNAHKLSRQLFISDRIKALNETIYYGVDALHDAITAQKQVSFKYYSYNLDKEKQYRNKGEKYVVSPYSLAYSEDNYYLICRYPKYPNLSHFRVDRMTDIVITDQSCDNLKEIMGENFNIGKYSVELFGMYAGNADYVELICDNTLINPIIDRFGIDIPIRKFDNNNFVTSVKVNIGPAFFAWIFMFEGKVDILSPDNIKERYKEMCLNITKKFTER